MAYEPTKWVDTLKDGEEIIQKGTPVNSVNMNKIEDQLVHLTDKVEEKGKPNGYASLDENGKVPNEEIPTDIVTAAEEVNSDKFVVNSEKDQPNGIPTLDATGKVKRVEIPTDVIEVTDSVKKGDYVKTSEKNAASGVATLDSSKKLISTQIPTDVAKVVTDTKAGVYVKASEKGVPNGIATIGADGIIPSSLLPTNLKEIKIVTTIAQRDALSKFEGLRVMVTDASADTTVNSGWAEYVWDGSKFIKTNEAESIDLVIGWNNVVDKPTQFTPVAHTHTEADIVGLDKYTKAQVDNLLAGKSSTSHSHTWAQVTSKPTTFAPTTGIVNGLNMDNVTATGFYQGYTMTNAAVTTISTFIVINYSVDWIVQIQIVPGATQRTFIRSKYNGSTWGAWKEMGEKDHKHAPADINLDASNRFVTDAQIQDWTAKETTTGAQTKANTAETNAKTFASNLVGVKIIDTRSVTSLPLDYTAYRSTSEFKLASVMGLTGLATGMYVHVFTERGWQNDSGGYVRQLAYDGNSNKVFTRHGSNSANTWNSWDTISFEGHTHNYNDLTNIPTTFKPEAHNHDDRYYTETEVNGMLNGKSDTGHTHDYNSLTNKPTIPSKVSDLSNDSSFVSSNASRIYVQSTQPTDMKENDIWIQVL